MHVPEAPWIAITVVPGANQGVHHTLQKREETKYFNWPSVTRWFARESRVNSANETKWH